ncbi:MAG TPA: phosphatidate cytidylyltransferase [Candidatus Eisenbacteria bacterium]|nr:phosphatidate cytidylyltransferase [Candidatus Eisenbacteria bacterium]
MSVPAEPSRRAALARRVGSSAVLIALVALAIFSQSPLFFSLVVTMFVGVALFEFFALFRRGNIPVSPVFGLLLGVAIPIVVYLESGGTQSGEILFLVLACFFLFILKFFRNDPQSLVGISLTLFGVLYISWFSSFLIKIRFLQGGVMWVTYLLTVTKAADIGAYAVGSLFGRHPLAPHISPKKSVEGLVAGLAASAGASLAFHGHLPYAFTAAHCAVLGLLIAIVGQIGDLSESLMKRFCQAKDSGAILPGMGGVMDVADSVIFTAPIFYFHLRLYL